MRRVSVLVLILFACFVSAAPGQQSAANSQNNWSEFLRTNMGRWNPYEHVLNVQNVKNLRRKWSFQSGGVFSSPAVVDGVVYVGSQYPQDRLYALKASTGVKLWSYRARYRVWSSPAVANGVVYVGAEDKNVYALNARTGTKVWNYTTGGKVDSSPSVVDGVVYIGSDDGNLYALNASTGAMLWNYATGYQDSAPAVANGVVYVLSLIHI